MIGLDFRTPIRAVCLKALPDKRFLVTHCEIIDNLADFSPDASQLINIALPDSWVLNIQKEDHSLEGMAWDCHGELSVMTSLEKRDKILAPFKSYLVHALDIESEAIGRALRILCNITDQYMAVLYYDKNHLKVYLSIFKDQQKIFFHQENVLDNNIDIIIRRAFKLFSHSVQIQCYSVGDQHPDILKWGTVPNITQQLEFESDINREKFQKDNTQWLLASGLSLWDKKSSWNLMPWRENDKQKERKILFKQMLKAIAYGLGVVLLAHGLILLALHFQDEHNGSLDEKIRKLNTKALTANQAEQEINTLQGYIKILNQFSADQLVAIQFLNNLSQSMPDGVFLNSLTVDYRKATITGRAETEAQMNTLLDTLKHHSGLINVMLKSVTQDESNPPYHFDFNIEMEFN